MANNNKKTIKYKNIRRILQNPPGRVIFIMKKIKNVYKVYPFPFHPWLNKFDLIIL